MERKMQTGKIATDLTIKTLEFIGEFAVDTAELFAMVLSGEATSPVGVVRGADRISKKREKQREWREEERRRKRQFYDLLYRLKRDGLIDQKANQKKSWWTSTQKGKTRLMVWKKRKQLSLPATHYAKMPSEELKIISFDIPERYKRKREWLRDSLRNMGFTMLQKSVWLGKQALSEEFMENLRDLNLLQYIEIFAVTKSGSLKHL